MAPEPFSLLQVMREEMLHFQAVLPWRCLKPSFMLQHKEWRARASQISTYMDFTKGYRSLSQVSRCHLRAWTAVPKKAQHSCASPIFVPLASFVLAADIPYNLKAVPTSSSRTPGWFGYSS